MKKINKKVILMLLVLLVIIIMLSNFLVSYIYYFVNGNVEESFTYVDFAFRKASLIITAAITLVCFSYFSFIIVKRNLLGFQTVVQDSTRAKSSVYDNAQLMSSDEITNHFGNFEDETFVKQEVKENEDGTKVVEKEILAKYDYKWSELDKYNFEGLAVRTYKKNKDLYVDSISKKNTIVIGTPGSGKTLYFISPTIEANAKSKRKSTMIINDLKGELYARHSRMLKEQGYNVVVLNLRTPRKSLCFNPLANIYDLYHLYLETKDYSYLDKCESQISDVAFVLIPQSSGENSSFVDGARGLLIGIIWAMLEDSAKPGYGFTREMFTIGQISNIVNKQTNKIDGKTNPLIQFLKERRDTDTSKVLEAASAVIASEASEKTFASYMSTFSTYMQDYFKGAIQHITSKDDIKLNDIVNNPTALFLIIPDESKAYYSVATLVVQQIYNYLIDYASTHPVVKKTRESEIIHDEKGNKIKKEVEKTIEEPTLERPVYFLLDEFGNMPKISAMQTWITISRSRKVYFTLILQSKSQLQAVYGEQEMKIIMDSCQMQMYLGSNEIETIKFFQEKMGTYTAFSHSANVNEKNINQHDFSGSTSLIKRDVVNLSELQYMKPGTAYFIVTREKPVKTTLIPHFDADCREKKYFEDGKIDIMDNNTSTIPPFYNLEKRHSVYSSNLENDFPQPEENTQLSEKIQTQKNTENRSLWIKTLDDCLNLQVKHNRDRWTRIESQKDEILIKKTIKDSTKIYPTSHRYQFESLEDELLFDMSPIDVSLEMAATLQVKDEFMEEDIF